MAVVKIIQVKSLIGCPQRQRLTLRALKLGKVNSTVKVEFTLPIQGMVRQVSHLVTIENI
jgi:large subunit ribosomal protein L30